MNIRNKRLARIILFALLGVIIGVNALNAIVFFTVETPISKTWLVSVSIWNGILFAYLARKYWWLLK